jgi:hypothetical protein
MTIALSNWTQAVSPWSWDASAFTPRRIVVFGLLWAAAQTALASYGLPVEGLSRTELLRLWAEVYITYALQGVFGAFIAKRVAADFNLSKVVLAILFVAFGVSGIRFVLERSLGLLSNFPPFGDRSVWTAYLFDASGSLLSGGLFMLGCIFSLRSEHTRILLGQAEIARGQTEALLSEAELQTLRGHVDPALLLRVMAEVQRRYAGDAGSADRLLEQLVNFLRRAMPGVRTGTSTLAADVKLVRAHARLLAEVAPQHTIWRIRVEPGLAELPFPPLLLLPVLDALAAACPPASACTLAIGRADEAGSSPAAPGIMLRLDGPVSLPHWLPEALERRLRVGLAAVFGHAWSLHVGDAATANDPALVLTLSSPAPHGIASQRLVSPPHPEIHDE